MKRTRHQFAPAMPGQKVIDRAVAGPVPNGLLIGRLEIVDVQHLSGPGGLGEARQQGLLLSHRHVLALASAARLGLERLDPAVVIETPMAAAIAGCAIPLSRSNTIWMR